MKKNIKIANTKAAYFDGNFNQSKYLYTRLCFSVVAKIVQPQARLKNRKRAAIPKT